MKGLFPHYGFSPLVFFLETTGIINLLCPLLEIFSAFTITYTHVDVYVCVLFLQLIIQIVAHCTHHSVSRFFQVTVCSGDLAILACTKLPCCLNAAWYSSASMSSTV